MKLQGEIGTVPERLSEPGSVTVEDRTKLEARAKVSNRKEGQTKGGQIRVKQASLKTQYYSGELQNIRTESDSL